MFDKVTDNSALDASVPAGSKMSVEAMNSVKRGIILGVIKSLGLYLFNHEADQKAAGKKMLTFINAMRASKDISEYEGNWQYDEYFGGMRSTMYATDADCCAPVCSSAYMSWYQCIANLLDDTHAWAFSFTKEGRKQLTEKECAIVDNLQIAQEAYYKARSAFEDYFREVNKQVLKDILIKYGTVLCQIAPDWFNDVRYSAGLVQPKEQNPES